MMKKKFFAAALAGVLALQLSACGGGASPDSNAAGNDNNDTTGGGASQSEPFEISMILKTTGSEFWQILQRGAEAYEEEHPDLVKLSIKGPPSESEYEQQLNSIQTDLSVDSYDGYLIAPLQSDAVANKIADVDRPVIAFDTNIDSPKCISFVGTGNKEAAKQGAIAAVEAAKAAGWEEIKCIEIAGVQGDATNTARMEGFREGITESGGEFLDKETQYANAVADQAVTCMEGIIGKYPEGIAIICSNNDDMATAAARVAKSNENYKNTIILGFDGQQGACEAILEGTLTMTAAQNNYELGYKAVETMVQALQGKEVPPVVDTGTEIVTKDNAQDRLDRLTSYLK